MAGSNLPRIVQEHTIELNVRKVLTPDSGIPSMWEVEVAWQDEVKTVADQNLYHAVSLALMMHKIEPLCGEDLR